MSLIAVHSWKTSSIPAEQQATQYETPSNLTERTERPQVSQSRSKIGKVKPKYPEDPENKEDGLLFGKIECGRWETDGEAKEFRPYLMLNTNGVMVQGPRELTIKTDRPKTELVMTIDSIRSLAMSPGVDDKFMVVIALALAPRIYERRDLGEEEAALLDLLRAKRVTCFRDTNVPGCDQKTTGSCLVYRLTARRYYTHIRYFKEHLQDLTSYRINIVQRRSPKLLQSKDFASGIAYLQSTLKLWEWSFSLRYQVEKLWANALLSPDEIQALLPDMAILQARVGSSGLISVLRRLDLQLQVADVYASGVKEARLIMQQQEAFLQHEDQITSQRQLRDEVYVHSVTVTPTGVYLYGPDEIAANRVLREHRAHQECFLRVSFTDENEDRLEFDRDISNEKILRGRFLSVLQQGLDIAGEHFDFLGFSHSSLRSQSCWFMRPFSHDGRLVDARSLIKSLGDFSSIRCPAKCAARIGQAFSETTSAIQIDPSVVRETPDIRAGQHIFTDGCGTISKQTWKLLRGDHSAKDQPTLYQIRYKGAKGMISLDTRLVGKQLRLRESMIKFTGSPSNEIEICGTNARPLPFKLNRQLIKILEDLHIPAAAFERLQEDAVRKLRSSATSTSSAIDFIRLNLNDTATGLPALLKAVAQVDIDVTEDSFLRDILGALLQIQLREIKYRSRILVPDALTLYGICDETGLLKEGEIFVTFNDPESHRQSCVNGKVVVTRSPALHPGDVQVATAVSPPGSSSLWDLRNCVVFSQKGQRDLPSMLSGGDLDGDLYNIIYDDSLIPRRTEQPASYLPAQPVDIGRAVTVDDMTGFFIDFMQNDQLGRIATLHLVMADDEEGTRSQACLSLAELHSTAVDFSKTGIPASEVNPRNIPKAPPFRPDFMAPSASTRVEKGIKRPTDSTLDNERPQRYRYYESDRVLGKLYRAIDEDIFFEDLEDDTSSLFSKDASDNVMREIWRWVRGAMRGRDVKQYLTVAQEVRD
ncbi:hypothetical protein PMZ80_007818 [Knufia obscura]|uniref:RNA-dependent RNA polymerase n=1 Tax=Knufia obscura TaxID=1635080 RepID=A0ABR0RJF3_9EURO|nr:hypothetical protein PMZ80_007818 [Knufia obscura]